MTSSKAWTVLLFSLGIVSSWVCHPLVWLALGSPIRALRYLLAMAYQESGYSVIATNDDEPNGYPSYGLLQYNQPVLDAWGVSPDAIKGSAFYTGWLGIRYIQEALLTDWRWWLIRIPGLGFLMTRLMWRAGRSSSTAKKVFDLSYMTSLMEGRSINAYLVLTLMLGWIPALALIRRK